MPSRMSYEKAVTLEYQGEKETLGDGGDVSMWNLRHLHRPHVSSMKTVKNPLPGCSAWKAGLFLACAKGTGLPTHHINLVSITPSLALYKIK